MLTNDFISKAKEKHNNKYIYDKTIYINQKTKIIVTCLEHGDFSISPSHHLYRGSGCVLCANRQRWITRVNDKVTYESFVKRSLELHSNKYSYPVQTICGNRSNVKIMCPIHGEFTQIASAHLSGAGCAQCGNCAKANIDSFITKAQAIHGDRYKYDKFTYVNSKVKGIITCNIHGDFEQSPDAHINAKSGCNRCGSGGTYNEWYFNTYPEMKDINGTLYIVKMSNEDESFIKVGITMRNHKNRLSQIAGYCDYKVEEIMTLNTTLYDAWQKEQLILAKNKDMKYEPKQVFHGHTECLNEAAILRGVL